MKLFTKQEALDRMNLLGESGKPFLFIIDYDQAEIFIEEPHLIDSKECLFNLNGFTNVDNACNINRAGGELMGNFNSDPERTTKLDKDIKWVVKPVSWENYKRSFQNVIKNINDGNSYLTNLTCATLVETNHSLQELFLRSDSLYKMWFKDRFVFFSPEIFVRIQNGEIYSYPMKGTIDASLPDAEHCILNDLKESAEHATIVDLIRNDLSIVAKDVTVSKYRYLDKITTNKGSLLQVSSEIKGKLPVDYSAKLGDILFALLPAGSITGAPKKKTQAIISESETHKRGFYTGIAGYFDGERLDSTVMIRFIEQADGKFYFKSGGGITAKSNLESEYNEMIQKVYVPLY